MFSLSSPSSSDNDAITTPKPKRQPSLIEIESSPPSQPVSQQTVNIPAQILVKIRLTAKWTAMGVTNLKAIPPPPARTTTRHIRVEKSPDGTGLADGLELGRNFEEVVRPLQRALVNDAVVDVARSGIGDAVLRRLQYTALAHVTSRKADEVSHDSRLAEAVPRGAMPSIPYIPYSDILTEMLSITAPSYSLVVIFDFDIVPHIASSTPIHSTPLDNPFQSSSHSHRSRDDFLRPPRPRAPAPDTPASGSIAAAIAAQAAPTPGMASVVSAKSGTTTVRKSHTNQMLEEVDKRRQEDPDHKIWMELTTMWTCKEGTRCKNYRAGMDPKFQFCFVPKHDSRHYNLGPHDLRRWVRAIHNQQATLSLPPEELWNRWMNEGKQPPRGGQIYGPNGEVISHRLPRAGGDVINLNINNNSNNSGNPQIWGSSPPPASPPQRDPRELLSDFMRDFARRYTTVENQAMITNALREMRRLLLEAGEGVRALYDKPPAWFERCGLPGSFIQALRHEAKNFLRNEHRLVVFDDGHDNDRGVPSGDDSQDSEIAATEYPDDEEENEYNSIY
ncbi:hypothetical protein VTJ04DRAFT_2121 [Mycothermus thermophilus]|uniref:uncharacterized protein n=1 Tax=Humicola insolens TaxID=85995 RepID=UPI003742C8C3